jgi:hypothetical protein
VSRQNVIIIVVALGAFLSFSLVQAMFDRADHDKALKLVRQFAGKSGETIEDLLARKDPGAHSDLSWSTEILSGCRGFVRVTCRLPQHGDDYVFDVDLVRRGIHPGDEGGRQVLEALQGNTVPGRPR